MAEVSSTEYQYSPLHNSTSIRLVKILDPSLDEPPCCYITEADLNAQPTFLALSYTWGSAGVEATKRGVTAERCKIILCQGKIIRISENLSDFINDIVRFHRNLCGINLWIDAICINQADTTERSQQVQLMGDIYTQADTVIIWLGKEENTSHLAIEFLNAIADSDLPFPPAADILIEGRQPLNQYLGELADSEDHWISWELMMRRTWFSRTWILQEFCLAADATFLCGQHSIDVDRLAKASSIALHHPSSQLSRFATASGAKMVDMPQLKSGIRRKSPGALFSILLYVSSSIATDSRDMVYGVIGLIKRCVSERSELQSMQVSYQRPTADVYIRYTRLLLSEKPELLLFKTYDMSREALATFKLELPSWVPNYSNPTNGVHGNFTALPSNNAAKGLQPLAMVIRRVDGLVVNAQKVDIIRERLAVFEKKFLDSSGHWIANALPDMLRFLCKFEPEYFDGQPRSQILWLTLAADRLRADVKKMETTTIEQLGPIFGLWVGFCLLALARERCAKPEEVLDTYHRMLFDLSPSLLTISKSENIFMDPYHLARQPMMSLQSNVIEAIQMLHRLLQTCATAPVLLRTKTGLIGKSTKNVRIGDEIWLVGGVPVPVLLRKTEDGKYYKMVDIVYVHGIMQGEFIEQRGLHNEEIELV